MPDYTEVLTEIRDALREISQYRHDGRVTPQPSDTPIRARTALVPSRGAYNLHPQPLQPFARQISEWKEAGRTYAEIVALLAELGVKTNDSSLSRFVRGRLMPDSQNEA